MLTVITDDKAQNTCFCNITLTDPVDNLFKHVVESLNYESENFELLMETQNEQQINLNEYKGKQIKDIGLNDDESSLKISIKMKQEEEPPTTTQPAATEDYSVLVSEWLDDTHKKQYQKMEYYPLTHTAQLAIANQANNYTCNYVGLVNQAMTCYLNSLLQTLYMTPEFRNALYNWEFDGQNATRSIPFQLQKLFLNLQTSQKSAIETTDLTTSFGWQGSEAWQQHDIQELCRVMFDALEQKFKDTKQANLINDLYEGKMLDYVRCLECGTEKSREDTFLDIPLPVRPFGSETAYNTVEKALRAFVLPETLDGNNQYYCEKCQKKCDAHKGLKFTKFPYLLTLHLKRFDFDYNTMHRIKLNDRIRFPETLNLNPFIQTTTDGEDEKEASVKCDDCSTTDSGSALDDETCQVADTSSSINGQDLNIQEEDEGIDMSIGSGQLETEKGPYIYELFSIMIHSGSASGGHYYAYIKDFTTNLWYCFNDQNVTRITEDDIKKTYGGGTRRGHYSGAYSSSTNAYMLMYRQIDRKRNCTAITADNFPPHIVTLLKQMNEKEEQDRLSKEKENDMVRLLVHCVHPVTGQTQTVKKLMFMVSELGAVVREVYEQLKLEDVVRVEDCRLVAYNKLQDCIECSFDSDEIRLCDITPRVNSYNEWMLEIKPPGMEFQKYKPGGTSMKVYFIDVEHEEIEGPTNVRLNADDTVGDFKRIISKLWNLDSSDSLKVVQENNIYDLRYLEDDDCPMKFDLSTGDHKVFVANILDEDPTKSFPSSKLNKLIETCRHVVNIEVVFPIVNPGTLEALDIPPLDLNQNLDKLDMIGDRPVSNSPNLRTTSPQQVSVCEGFGDQSNSEDSSLSDSDRTLVGDAPGDCLGLLSSSSESPADQHMASPSDPAEDMYNPEVFGQPMVSEDMHWDDDEPVQKETKHYFRLLQRRNINSWDNLSDSDASHVCRVMVDKQMHVEMFKKCLAPMVCVPDEYFKLYVHYQNQNDEVPRHETLKSLKDNEKLVIKLGRVLRSDEYISNIYHLQPEKTEVSTFLFEHIIEAGKTVGAVKKEILCQAKKVHMLNIPHSKCRLRKKNWKIPGKVFLDHQKFVEDIHISSNVELFLQELDDVEKVTSPDQLVVFIRHWHPSTLTLDPPTEVVLDEPTVEELKKQISIVSLIPAEFVEIAHTKCVFPCDTNVLNIHNECSWNAKCTLLKEWPMHVHDDGNLFYFRDSRERLKELSKEEEEELKKKEMAKMGLSYGKKKYAPGRERALKIYVDTSPSKSDDGCVD